MNQTSVILSIAIDRYSQRASLLKAINETIQKDPEFLPELYEQIGNAVHQRGDDVEVQKPLERKRLTDAGLAAAGGTVAERVRAFIKSHPGTTAPEIMRATGLDRGAISHALYMSHSKEFESRPHPDKPRQKAWYYKNGEHQAA